MEFSYLVENRESVRVYTGKSITAGQARALLEAGIRAPNACNLQSWHFYAVADREKICAVHGEVAHIPWAKDIPLLIVVCIQEDVAHNLEVSFGESGRRFAEQDAAGAINMILLKAMDMGLGGCWIGPMNTQKCRQLFGISEKHTPVGILTIGEPAQKARPRGRKPLEEAVTYVGTLPESI